VGRTARYHVLGDPSAAAEVWFALHGYGQLAGRFIGRFAGLVGADGTRAVVAPEALSRFYVEGEVGPHGRESRVGASWMTREGREGEIDDYVAYLDGVAATVLEARAPTSPRVVVLGFSQGAETASRWAAYGEVLPGEFILWGGGLAADLDMARAAEKLRGVPVRLVVGDADGWAQKRAEASLVRLNEAGIPAEVVRYPGGHRIEPAVLARL
jgi:predicted esterase